MAAFRDRAGEPHTQPQAFFSGAGRGSPRTYLEGEPWNECRDSSFGERAIAEPLDQKLARNGSTIGPLHPDQREGFH